jgi:hypothetical protein
MTDPVHPDPRETQHIECDCVPDLGPSHCHLCGKKFGRPIAWSEATLLDGHQPGRVKNQAENLNVTPTSQVSLHDPDQPYMPSDDQVLRDQIMRTLNIEGAYCGECGYEEGYTGPNGCPECARCLSSYADALLPLIASVRRDAMADAVREHTQMIMDLTKAETVEALVQAGMRGRAEGVFMAQEELVKRDQFTMRTLDILNELEAVIRRTSEDQEN